MQGIPHVAPRGGAGVPPTATEVYVLAYAGFSTLSCMILIAGEEVPV